VLIVRKRPTLLKLLCGLAVVVGLFVCLIPTIFPAVDPKAGKTKTEAHGVSRVMWPLIFMLGFVSNLYTYAFRLLSCASASKRVMMQNLSHENEFDLHENEPVGGTHFHMNGFAQRIF